VDLITYANCVTLNLDSKAPYLSSGERNHRCFIVLIVGCDFYSSRSIEFDKVSMCLELVPGKAMESA